MIRFQFTVCFLLATGALLACGLPLCHAAADPAPATSALAGVAALHKADQKLNSAASIRFAAVYTALSAKGKATSYRVAGIVAKPNRGRITVAPLAPESKASAQVIISSDGKQYSVAAIQKRQYAVSGVYKEGFSPSGIDTTYFESNVIGDPAGVAQDLADTLMPVEFDAGAEHVPAGIKRVVTTTSRLVRLDGRRCLDVEQKVVGIRHTIVYHTLIDTRSRLPRELATYSDNAGGPKLLERIVFTKLQRGSNPAAAQLAYAPPASMQLFHAAAAPGTYAPDFTVLRPDGTQVHLSDYKGKVVVLDFWATWCPPCLKTLPTTNKLATKLKSQDVVFLPICTWDTKSRFDAWLPAHSGWTLPWLFDKAGIDENKSVANAKYAVSGIPAQYVIGKDGTIVYRGFADSDAGEQPLIAAIQKAMAAS